MILYINTLLGSFTPVTIQSSPQWQFHLSPTHDKYYCIYYCIYSVVNTLQEIPYATKTDIPKHNIMLHVLPFHSGNNPTYSMKDYITLMSLCCIYLSTHTVPHLRKYSTSPHMGLCANTKLILAKVENWYCQNQFKIEPTVWTRPLVHTYGWQWPTLTVTMPAKKSRYLRPVWSKSHCMCPWWISRGSL